MCVESSATAFLLRGLFLCCFLFYCFFLNQLAHLLKNMLYFIAYNIIYDEENSKEKFEDGRESLHATPVATLAFDHRENENVDAQLLDLHQDPSSTLA